MTVALGPRERALVDEYPWIAWLEPQPVRTGSYERLTCRLCTAINGLKAHDPGYKTREQWARHVKTDHTPGGSA